MAFSFEEQAFIKAIKYKACTYDKYLDDDYDDLLPEEDWIPDQVQAEQAVHEELQEEWDLLMDRALASWRAHSLAPVLTIRGPKKKRRAA